MMNNLPDGAGVKLSFRDVEDIARTISYYNTNQPRWWPEQTWDVILASYGCCNATFPRAATQRDIALAAATLGEIDGYDARGAFEPEI